MKHKTKAAEIHTIGFGPTRSEEPGDVLFSILGKFHDLGVDKPELRVRLEQYHPRGGQLEWKPQFNLFLWNRLNSKNECVVQSWDINDIRRWLDERAKNV